jgi:hypothetical protein
VVVVASIAISSQTGPLLHAAGFEKREQIVKVSRAPPPIRGHSAVAETTASRKGYCERKAFVTLSNTPVTVARCPKQHVLATQPLPQLEKESVVVQTHSTCPSCLPAKTTLVLEEGYHKTSLRDVRSTDSTGARAHIVDIAADASGAGIVD